MLQDGRGGGGGNMVIWREAELEAQVPVYTEVTLGLVGWRGVLER